jgi:hypothetical protein
MMRRFPTLPSSLPDRQRRWLLWAAVLLIMLAGLALRLIDLRDPPLDVHGWRQMRSAIIARAIYLDHLPGADQNLREKAHYFAATLQSLEPPIFENLVAISYRAAGQELLWIARLWAIFFWLGMALLLFLLARRMVSTEGGLVALAFVLFLPFAVSQSRAFLPEPLMILLIWLALYAAVRWVDSSQVRWALLTGLFAGLAILVKVFAVYFILGGIGLLLLSAWGVRKTLRSWPFYAALALAVIIPAIYYLILHPGSAGGYLTTWTIPYLHLLKDPLFYIAWLHRLEELFNPALLVLAVAGLVLLPPRARAMTAGLWIGYLLLGFSVPSLIRSHLYYNLVVTPTIALSLAAFARPVLEKARQQRMVWQILLIGVILVGLGDTALFARKELTRATFRQEPAFWQQLASAIPADGDLVGLTEDYNGRMMYYGWRYVAPYPYSYDQDMVRMAGGEFDVSGENWQYFLERTAGKAYFVVTELDEFTNQPYLKTILYDHYPIVVQGDRYVVFDLRHPTAPIPVQP